MPIVQLELVIRGNFERISGDTLQGLADELGEYFQTDRAATWVKVDYLPFEQYAENQAELGGEVKPTLVYVLKYRLPPRDRLAQEAKDLARIVARRLQRPEENTHIIFEPDGVGRVAFGGELVT